MKPIVGTEDCEAHHVGYEVAGRMHVVDTAGAETEIGAGEAYGIAPGHDAWIIGDDTFIDRVDLARSDATAAPRAIDHRQVIEHGLRHLAWLAMATLLAMEGAGPFGPTERPMGGVAKDRALGTDPMIGAWPPTARRARQVNHMTVRLV